MYLDQTTSLHALACAPRMRLRWIKPLTTSCVLGPSADLTRGKAELLAEHVLLRHQLLIQHRQVERPIYQREDRLLLILLDSMVRTWKEALFLVQPETLLRGPRELFRCNHAAGVSGVAPVLSCR